MMASTERRSLPGGREARESHLVESNEFSDFIAHLHLKNLSARTITEYRKVLRSLFSHLGLSDSSPKEITTAELREYVATLQGRGLAPKTVSNHVLVIKGFFGFLLAKWVHDGVGGKRG